jgi:hypothetical protein
VAEAFHEPDQPATVRHSIGPCRKWDGESCTYLITW